MSTASRRRLIRDFKRLSSDPPGGVSGAPCGDNIMIWNAVIFGPGETPFEDGTFRLLLTFDEQYPNKPPTVKFTSKMFHPNVYANGELCLDILQNRWSPTYDVAAVLTSIQSLLHDPNPNSPANSEAASLYSNNMKEYIRRTKKRSNKSNIANDLSNLSIQSAQIPQAPQYSQEYSSNALLWLSMALTPASLDRNTQVHEHVLRYNGWVSASHLIKHTPFLNQLKPFNGQQQLISQHIRNDPDCGLECMLDGTRGICIRRADTLDMDLDVDEMSVYLQGLPLSLSTYQGVFDFLKDKVPEIQSLHFPRLFSKGSDATGVYRGMVFVSFWSTSDASSVLTKWPWLSGTSAVNSSKNQIRSLSVQRWNELQEEYTAYCNKIRQQNQSHRAQLCAAAETHQSSMQSTSNTIDPDVKSQNNQDQTPQQPQFPSGCVLELTDVDSTTSKPAIRADVLKAVDQSELAYIEYTKALSLAVIRFTTSAAAAKAQQALGGEIISGIREANYWNSIPERLRLQALEKSGQASIDSEIPADSSEQGGLQSGLRVDAEDNKTKKKRRKSNKGDLVAGDV
ncbi:hypothetical protein E3P99_02345 [Wallemia hederae]|uniref:UBC core domain-containing protein n=1 Tax=Wallemia hederae TaxID=1540922 RepID=A0A4T0FKU0_9BASI|nr:hypothetical protein E3P99_02345 [Wallemia hederae]